MNPMDRRAPVTDVDELRALVGEPTDRVAKKVRPELLPIHLDWLARSPFAFVATTDAQGRVDVSPKGDPPGFVHVIDSTTIAIPERPGNRRVDGYLNVLSNPHVGTNFLVPGRGDTLRINGTATILRDADYFDALAVRGRRPILALEVAVEEVFFHCAKAFMRAKLWRPETWEPDALPSTAEITHVLNKGSNLAELREHYGENYAKLLY
jgi:PPOX class probable FMN-dependent enzyme